MALFEICGLKVTKNFVGSNSLLKIILFFELVLLLDSDEV